MLIHPRLPEAFFVTRLPKGGGYHQLPPSLDVHIKRLILMIWVLKTGMSLLFPLIPKSNSSPFFHVTKAI